jgi:hypothetical protein
VAGTVAPPTARPRAVAAGRRSCGGGLGRGGGECATISTVLSSEVPRDAREEPPPPLCRGCDGERDLWLASGGGRVAAAGSHRGDDDACDDDDDEDKGRGRRRPVPRGVGGGRGTPGCKPAAASIVRPSEGLRFKGG